jgi:hypothetical protein
MIRSIREIEWQCGECFLDRVLRRYQTHTVVPHTNSFRQRIRAHNVGEVGVPVRGDEGHCAQRIAASYNRTQDISPTF